MRAGACTTQGRHLERLLTNSVRSRAAWDLGLLKMNDSLVMHRTAEWRWGLLHPRIEASPKCKTVAERTSSSSSLTDFS